jgi:DMSO/TMAO reductase YedYZ molybdopterin-dependent catalytic subunit
MPGRSDPRWTRREWLSASVLASGSLLLGADLLASRLPSPHDQRGQRDEFAGGKELGIVEFSNEPNIPMNTPLGSELDGREFTDLSSLNPKDSVVPTDKFYIRTRASRLLDLKTPWTIRLGGPEHPEILAMTDLLRDSEPQGLHLMECAGNVRTAHFGMISVADWTGVPLSRLAARLHIGDAPASLLVSGFDTYANPSVTSVPGASWIFPWDLLHSAGAFLATKMNGQPLTPDHGSPVRLVVPGWYGCTCIKWVNEISLADAKAEATSQMQEYASRTMQNGVPKMAAEYKPATIDPAAMPIRVEKWQVAGKIKYCVVGILWGEAQPVKTLQIQFNPDEDYVAVENLELFRPGTWRFWTHAWSPRKLGAYVIRLRVTDPPVRTQRLDAGYYTRTVDILEL